MRIELKKDPGYIRRRRRYVFRKFTQAVAGGFLIACLLFVSRGIDNNINFLAALLCEVCAAFSLWIGGSLE